MGDRCHADRKKTKDGEKKVENHEGSKGIVNLPWVWDRAQNSHPASYSKKKYKK